MKFMTCIKCFKRCKGKRPKGLPDILSHLDEYTICDKCDDTGTYAKDYYNKHKEHYRELHIAYKAELADSYVANTIVDRTDLKAKDIPEQMIELKRAFMKINRIIKESK